RQALPQAHGAGTRISWSAANRSMNEVQNRTPAWVVQALRPVFPSGHAKETRMRHLRTALLTSALVVGTANAQGFPPVSPAQDDGTSETVLVDLRDDLSDAQLQALMTQYGVKLDYNSVYSHQSKLMRIEHVDIAQGNELVAELEKDARVEEVEP